MAFFWLPLPVWYPPVVQQFGGILIRFEASMLSNAIFVAFCGIMALLNARAFELIKKSQSHTSVQNVYSLDSEGCQAVFYGA